MWRSTVNTRVPGGSSRGAVSSGSRLRTAQRTVGTWSRQRISSGRTIQGPSSLNAPMAKSSGGVLGWGIGAAVIVGEVYGPSRSVDAAQRVRVGVQQQVVAHAVLDARP